MVEASRASFDFTIRLSPDIAAKFAKDGRESDTYRIMVFCATDPVSSFVKLDVTFPNQIELRVNSAEVRSNLKGLKNKPGSTRPADITDLMRKTPPLYENKLVVTYALTSKVTLRITYGRNLKLNRSIISLSTS